MASEIIETPSLDSDWLQGLGAATARHLLAWEQAHADELLADVFGYHALQVGGLSLQALRANRMPHRWRAATEFEATEPAFCGTSERDEALWMDSRAWPWPAESLDLVVLPHTLEQSADPQACLREVERSLIPEGQVFITGLNPWSLWGWRQRRALRTWPAETSLAGHGQLLAPHRLRDWLELLGFEVQLCHFGGWTPALASERWRRRWAWLDRLGPRWWPILGGAYLMVATKRVPGGHLLPSRPWRRVRSAASSTVPVARHGVRSGP